MGFLLISSHMLQDMYACIHTCMNFKDRFKKTMLISILVYECFVYSFFFPVLGLELRALCMLCRHSTTELHP